MTLQQQPRARMRNAVLAGVLLASAVFASACSGSSTNDGSTARREPAAGEVFSLPVVDVLDVANGSKVAFGDLSPSEKPLLLWFWAPH